MQVKSDTMSTQPPLMDIIMVCIFVVCFFNGLSTLRETWDEIQDNQDPRKYNNVKVTSSNMGPCAGVFFNNHDIPFVKPHHSLHTVTSFFTVTLHRGGQHASVSFFMHVAIFVPLFLSAWPVRIFSMDSAPA